MTKSNSILSFICHDFNHWSSSFVFSVLVSIKC